MTPANEPQAAETPSAIELYRIALDEYRFQVNLNWQRTQHSFTLNVAIAGSATALLHFSNVEATYLLVGAIFACGAFACLLAIIAQNIQRGYYHSIRDHKKRLEEILALDTFAITTTSGMGNTQRRRFTVTTLNNILLAMICLLDLGGASYAIFQYVNN